jgi:cytochrome c biogenesis protein CcmG, thiol:disulfide interchange protein DsbE
MGKQESMTSDERSDLRPDRAPEDVQAGATTAKSRPRGRILTTVAAVLATATKSRGRRLALITTAAVLAVAAAIAAIGSTSGTPATPHSDPRAPAFTLALLGHSGQHISLAGLGGRPVIINFFASWCEPCQKETPLLARFYRAAHGSVTLIGVDANDKASAALKFTRAAGVSYPVGFDPFPMPTTISYGVGGLPQTFFLDSQHRIVKRVFGAVTVQELKAGIALMKRG